jgi:hypothetical protein
MVRRLVAGVAIVLALGTVVLLGTGPAMPAEPDGSQPPLTSPEGFANAEFEFVDSGQRLVIARDPGLAFGSVSDDPPPDSQPVEGNLTASETVTWFGEQDFPDQRPRAVLVPPGSYCRL